MCCYLCEYRWLCIFCYPNLCAHTLCPPTNGLHTVSERLKLSDGMQQLCRQLFMVHSFFYRTYRIDYWIIGVWFQIKQCKMHWMQVVDMSLVFNHTLLLLAIKLLRKFRKTSHWCEIWRPWHEIHLGGDSAAKWPSPWSPVGLKFQYRPPTLLKHRTLTQSDRELLIWVKITKWLLGFNFSVGLNPSFPMQPSFRTGTGSSRLGIKKKLQLSI